MQNDPWKTCDQWQIQELSQILDLRYFSNTSMVETEICQKDNGSDH